MVKLSFQKECIELIPDGVLELIFIEKVLKMIEDGDVAVCYRKNKPGGTGEIEKIMIESKKKMKMKPKDATSRERAIVKADELDDNVATLIGEE